MPVTEVRTPGTASDGYRFDRRHLEQPFGPAGHTEAAVAAPAERQSRIGGRDDHVVDDDNACSYLLREFARFVFGSEDGCAQRVAAIGFEVDRHDRDAERSEA